MLPYYTSKHLCDRGTGAMAQRAAADVEGIVEGKVSRRSVFVGLVASTIAGKAEADISSHKKIVIAAEALADAMKDAHGGEWRISIDHEAQLVVILGS